MKGKNNSNKNDTAYGGPVEVVILWNKQMLNVSFLVFYSLRFKAPRHSAKRHSA